MRHISLLISKSISNVPIVLELRNESEEGRTITYAEKAGQYFYPGFVFVYAEAFDKTAQGWAEKRSIMIDFLRT